MTPIVASMRYVVHHFRFGAAQGSGARAPGPSKRVTHDRLAPAAAVTSLQSQLVGRW